MINIDDCFKFCNLRFKAKEIFHDEQNPHYKCKVCALNYKGKKLCLNDSCECGECFGWSRTDGKNIIFVLDDGVSEKAVEKMLENHRETIRVHYLEVENERLKASNKLLVEQNRKLSEQNAKFESQLKSIYANINKAIKAEVYKNMPRVNKT